MNFAFNTYNNRNNHKIRHNFKGFYMYINIEMEREEY